MSDTTIQFEVRLLPTTPSLCTDGLCEVVNATLNDSINEPIDSFSLFYFDSITASVGWNKNDEFFTREELAAASQTIINQPLNLEHDVEITIGHIMGAYFIDAEHKKIDGELPEKFHLVSEGVLYKFLGKDPKRQKLYGLATSIVKEILSGASRWFVSMECVFKSFDYAVQEEDGSVTIIPRTEQNMYIDAYLKSSGGKGVYNNKRIGRAIRNINFIGQGLVRRPASDESIIFANLNELGVVSINTEYFEDKMTPEEIAALQKKYEDTCAEYKTSQDRWVAEKAALETALTEVTAKCKAEKDELVASVASLQGEKEEVVTRLNEAVASLTALKAEELKRTRMESIASIGVDVSYESVASFSDEQFEIFVTALKTVREKATPAEDTKSVDTNVTVVETVATVTPEVDADTVVAEIVDAVEPQDNLNLAVAADNGVKDSRTELSELISSLIK